MYEIIFANDYRLLKDVTGICLNKAGTGIESGTRSAIQEPS